MAIASFFALERRYGKGGKKRSPIVLSILFVRATGYPVDFAEHS